MTLLQTASRAVMIAALVSTVVTAAPTPVAETNLPPISAQAGSYDVGLMLGAQLEHNGLVPYLSVDELLRGLKDAVGGREITVPERDAALRFMRHAHGELLKKNEAAAQAYLAHNSSQAGVTTLPSGLQYRVLATGESSGRSPVPTDQVTVNYRLSLADGTELDRSDTHGSPATFRVGSVFKGWQEALLKMKPGSKWQIFVPPALGYGPNPPPPIPPGALLIYELDLLRVDALAPLDPTAKHPPGAVVKPSTVPLPEQ